MEVKKDKDELYHYRGACRFCGQMSELETIFPWTEDECHDAATEKCNCDDAVIWTRRRKRKKNAAKMIEEKFGDKAGETSLPEEIRNYLNLAAEQVAEDRIDKAVVHIGRIKVTIQNAKKGRIKIESILTKKQVEEM